MSRDRSVTCRCHITSLSPHPPFICWVQCTKVICVSFRKGLLSILSARGNISIGNEGLLATVLGYMVTRKLGTGKSGQVKIVDRKQWAGKERNGRQQQKKNHSPKICSLLRVQQVFIVFKEKSYGRALLTHYLLLPGDVVKQCREMTLLHLLF